MAKHIYNRPVLVAAVLLYLLIVICPFVDLLANWYITMIPVMYILYAVFRMPNEQSNCITIFCLAFALVLFEYWLIKHPDNFTSFFINGIIKWTPCFIAILCCGSLSLFEQKLILQSTIFAIFITSITTIVGLESFSNAARELAGAAEGEEREMYMRMNIGGFEFIYGLVILIPALFYLIRNSVGVLKYANILILGTNIYCIYLSSYTTALIILASIFILLLFEYNKKAKPFIIACGIILFLFAGSGILSELFFWASKNIGSEYVQDRFLQVAYLLQGQDIESINTETTNERLLLMKRAKDGFFSRPLFGNNWFNYNSNVLSGHSLVLDILSASGIIGLLIYSSLLWKTFKAVITKRIKNIPIESKLTWITFIAVTCINPSGFAFIYMIIYVYVVIINNLSAQINNK